MIKFMELTAVVWQIDYPREHILIKSFMFKNSIIFVHYGKNKKVIKFIKLMIKFKELTDVVCTDRLF